jgi:hypothetical protein
VFLNIPYTRDYERLFVALTVAVVCAGRTPRLTFEMRETGLGRLRRIRTVMAACQVSIHELCYACCRPARFNMPFELGLAVALRFSGERHDFHILESEPHRLQRTLSDLNGIDPLIHNNDPARAIRCVLSVIGRRGRNPPAAQITGLYQQIWKTVIPRLRKAHGDGLFSHDIYLDLVSIVRQIAINAGFVPADRTPRKT